MNKMIDVKALIESGHSIDDVLAMLRPEVEAIAAVVAQEEETKLAKEKSKDATDLGKMFAAYARKWHQNELVAKAFESDDVEAQLDAILGKFKSVDEDMKVIMNFLDRLGL